MKPYFQNEIIELYCGDCRDIVPCLTGKFDALVTDPPYGISFASQPTKWQRMAGMKPESWDEETQDIPDVTADKIAIWGGNYFALPPSRGWLVWYKPDAPPSMASCELAWTNQDQNIRQISHSISATNKERVGHPTQKPVRVIQWTMQQIGIKSGQRVVDTYMGSGTTAIACIRMGLKFVGIERDEDHCETALDRVHKELAVPFMQFDPQLPKKSDESNSLF